MTLTRKAYSASTHTLADQRQVRVICSTGEVDRAGEIIVQSGIDASAYMAAGAGTVLWNHNPDKPIAKCIEIGPIGDKLTALVQFPPEGEDSEADLYYGKIKFGSVSGVSIGFNPISTEPMDAGNPKKGPQKYTACELMEFSFTPVQANRGAFVVGKSTLPAAENWKVGASRNLPVIDDTGWDETEAETGILKHADFDSDGPDTTFARKGFLAYDAGNPDLPASYRLPFAKMIGGRLTAVASGIRAAADWLAKAGLPEDVATKARAVIDHYEAKMNDKAGAAVVTKDVKPAKVKGLYDVAQLAYLLMQVGYIEDSAEWEAEIEGDGSKVPAMLAAALSVLADAFLAMAAEEVAELLGEETEAGGEAVTKGHCAATAKPFVKAFVASHLKAGRKLSGETISTMQDACKAILSGHDMIAGMIPDPAASAADDEQPAASDTDKAFQAAKQKRLRQVELLRLSTAA